MDKILKEPRENIVIGFRQVKKKANNNHLRCVVIAKDTEDSLIAQIVSICQKKHIPYNFSVNKIEMGKCLEIDVNCSMCAVKKSSELS